MKRIAPLFVAVAVLLLPSVSHAIVTQCVGNAAQLAQALSSAGASTDPTYRIRLRSGTYTPTAQSGPFHVWQRNSSQVIEISGGWSGANGACETFTRDPAATVIQGSTDKTAFSAVTGIPATPGGNVTGSTVWLHGVTLRNTNLTVASYYDDNTGRWISKSACLEAAVVGSNDLLLERLHIMDCSAPFNDNASGDLNNYGGHLVVRDVLVKNGQAKTNGGVSVFNDGGVSELSQLTVTQTRTIQGDDSGLLMRAMWSGVIRLGNSVFWNNDAGFDVQAQSFGLGGNEPIEGGFIDLRRVHAQNIQYAGPGSSSGVTSGDPKFVSTDNPRLRSDSPLVDSGNASPYGGTGTYDADGKARVVGNKVDVGAFEYAQTNQAPNLGDASIQIPSTTPAGSLVYTFAATDDGLPAPGTLTYSLQSVQSPPGQGNPFALAGNGKLMLGSPLPQGQAGVYRITARVCDPAPLCDTGVLTVNVTAPPQSGPIFGDGFED